MGMSEEYINRIQRGLFVHSMGFYELVRESAKTCKNTAMVTINIWTIFSKLLETCCKTDHKLLMIELTQGLTVEIDKVKEDCAKQISGFSEKEAVLVKRINECETEISELDFKFANSQKDLMVSNDHIKTLNKQAEANSQVRMQIEKRLNELHNRKRRDDYAIAELQS
jgi:septal ring factor EnvC (AmiA/AmiB activator)